MSRPEYVVDASVAIEWILPEEGQAQAMRLQEMYQDEELDLVAPYLLISEVGNVLWKHVRRWIVRISCLLPRSGVRVLLRIVHCGALLQQNR